MANPRPRQPDVIDILSALPPNLVANNILIKLPYEDLNNGRSVSTSWLKLFTEKWEHLIERDMDIPLQTLYTFRQQVFAINSKLPLSFQTIYLHLRNLLRVLTVSRFNQKPLLKKYFFLQPQNHMTLLACCANLKEGAHFLTDIIPRDEAEAWMWLSLYANAENSVNFFISPLPYGMGIQPYHNLLEITAESGNLKMMTFLFGHPSLALIRRDRLPGCAARSGSLKMLQLVLQNIYDCNTVNAHTLADAAGSGNMEMVNFLLNPSSPFGTYFTLGTLRHAAASGNIKLLQHFLATRHRDISYRDIQYIPAHPNSCSMLNNLLDPENEFQYLEPCMRTLNEAAKYGNLIMLLFLLNPLQDFGLTPDINTLNQAALSGNLEMLQFLLDPQQLFGLSPNAETLRCAVKSGNLTVVRFLQNPLHNFGLRPVNFSVYEAASVGSLDITNFLLDPANSYNFEFSSDQYSLLTLESTSICLSLCQSHEAIINAFKLFARNRNDNAHHLLTSETARLSLRHFFRMTIHAVIHPDRYQLPLSSIEPIILAMQAAIRTHHTMIEREEIIKMLLHSARPELQKLINLFDESVPEESEQKRPRNML